MDTRRFQLIQTLFAAVVELEPTDASRYLRNHCPDTGVRSEVEALIRDLPDAETFFAVPSQEIAGAGPREPEAGERVGPYQIVRRIGRGGMGSVFLAVRADGEFEMQVAIKVVRAGMASTFFLQQFRAERRILAKLDHSHIGRLLDAGLTESGLPYVIMEYVEGLPITRWCDDHRKSIEDRLVLFRDVCAAVHHAHQRLVIHGDLKPGNIFVTPDGSPKLLDFGVGRLVEEAGPELADSDALLPRLLTPEYASPEQRQGGPLTTASDIYSLGVLLAELLAGNLPPAGDAAPLSSGGAGPDELAADRRGTTVGKLRRHIRGELNDIAGRALKEDPEQRYASAERLSDDVGRYLTGFAISARAESVRYLAAKFIGRHKIGIATACILVLAMIQIAVLARERRNENAHRLAELTALAIEDQIDLSDATQEFPGILQVREERAAANLKLLEQVRRETPNDLEVQQSLAYYYRRMGLMQYGSLVPHLGNSGAAIAWSRKSLDAYEQLARERVRAASNRPRSQINAMARTPGQILHAYAQLADLLVRTRRDFAAAADLHRKEEAAIAQISGGREGAVREADWQMANLIYREASDAMARNAPDEAILRAEESVNRLNRMMSRYPYDEDNIYFRSYAWLVLARALLKEGRPREALDKLVLARPGFEQSASRHPAWTSPRAQLILWRGAFAGALAANGQVSRAVDEARKALAEARNLADFDSVSKFGEETLAASLSSAGRTLESCGRKAEARETFDAAIREWTALVQHDPENREWRYRLDEARRFGPAAR